MAVLDPEKVNKITQYLRWNPRGITISDLSTKVKLNRNLVAKYLDMLTISGQVDMKMLGTAKVYFLSQRVPVSALIEFSSDYVIALDSEHTVIQVNEPVIRRIKLPREELIGKKLDELDIPFIKKLITDKLPGEENDIAENVSETACIQNGRQYYFRIKRVPTVFENGRHGMTFIIEDVTERKEAEEALKISEARYRGIVEDQTEFITRFQPDGTLVFANESYMRYLGEKMPVGYGEFFIPGIYNEDKLCLDRAFQSLDIENPVTTIECRISGPSGKNLCNLWSIRAIFDNDGHLHEYQGVGHDITEKCESAAKINNYIKMMQYLSKTSSDLMNIGDDEDIYEYVAQQVFSLAPGFLAWVSIVDEHKKSLIVKSVIGDPVVLKTIKKLTGFKFEELLIPITKKEIADIITVGKLVKAPPISILLEMMVPGEICKQMEDRAGGIDIYLMGLISKGRFLGDVGISIRSGSAIPQRELIEAFIHQAAIAIDRKIADDALKSSEQLYRSVIENIEDVYYRSDLDGYLILASPSWAKILGYESLDECIGKNIAETFWMDPAKRKIFLEQLGRTGAIRDYEVILKKKDGSPLRVAVSSHRFYDENGKLLGVEGIFHDITERHTAMEEIKNHIARMEFFSLKLQEFIQFKPDTDIYAKIVSDLKTLVPHAMILMNSYNNETSMITIRSLLGEEDRIKCTECLGFDPVGIEFPLGQTALTALKTGLIHKVPYSLYEATFKAIPEDICNRITNSVKIGDIYSIGFVRGGELFGNATIFLHQGAPLPDTSLIDTYAHAASIALQRDIAEQALKESERNQAEEDLKNSENYLLTIFNATQSGLMVIDPETSEIFDINSTAIELIGAPKSEILGKSCKKFLCHTEDAPCPYIDLREEIVRREGVLTTIDGNIKPVIKTVVPVTVGNHAYLLESFIDMSGRREAEAALQESEKWFRAIIEMIPQSVWECDIQGNLKYCNSRCSEMFRHTHEDFMEGLNIWQMIHIDDRERILDEFQDAIRHKPSKFPRHHELTGLRKDGTTFPMVVYHVPIVYKNEICGMRGICIDITDQKRIYNAMKEY